MSLYNSLFGLNPAAHFLLSALGLTTADVGRFRDCYLQQEGEELRIVIYTRNGGGNREAYEGVTAALQAHRCYLDDRDDDFDCTYASYFFAVPEKFKSAMGVFAAETVEPGQKWNNLIEGLKKGDVNDPVVKNAIEVGQSILQQISEAATEAP